MGEITWGTATATLAAPLVFLLPGWALLSLLLPPRHFAPEWRPDVAAWLALAAGLTLALTPVGLLLVHLAGLKVGTGAVLGLLVLSAIVVLWRRGPAWYAWWRRPLSWRERLAWLDAPFLALALVMGLIVGVRLWVVRGINYGFWGDSYQHTMITQLLLDNGGLFQSWEPYAPLRSFTYHFGFHGNVALFQWATAWLTGNPTPRTVVLVGQFLNALAALALYPLTVRLSGGHRWPGVVAVLAAGLLMRMPMYYVNWGRYTQLTGQVILPIALWFTIEALDPPKPEPRRWLLAGLTLGGLALTHYRSVPFVPCFLLPYLTWKAWSARREPRRLGQLAASLAGIGAISLVAIAPWLWNLLYSAYPSIAVSVVSDPHAATRQSFLYDNFWQWVAWPLAISTVLGIAVALWRRSAMGLIGAWLILFFLLANPHWLGLPGTGLVDNFLMLLALYLPVSMLTGFLVGHGIESLGRRWPAVQVVAGLLVLGIGIAGARARAAVLDPSYQIITERDAEAMRWIRANTPPDARFLVNSFFFADDHYVVGSDGGWWIPLLARRGNTVPPLLYATEAGADPDSLRQVSDLARHAENAALDDPETVAWLQEQGITHVYIGEKGGPLLDAGMLQASPYYHAAYHQGPIWIFALAHGGESDD